MRARFYAGFDGGGTRTTCVLCDSEGRALGAGSGGPSNYHNTGVGDALASVRQAFREALAQAGEAKDDGDDVEDGDDRMDIQACFGLAALDSPDDFEIMRRAIRTVNLTEGEGGGGRENQTYLVVNDWRIALAGAFIDDAGVILIAGTGSVAAAQRARGRRVVRVGGWGNIIDDRGSAYDIGRDALYAAMRDYDGRGPRTSLLELIMSKLKVSEPKGIIARVYVEQMPVSEIASLSTLVSQAADEGDAVASGILGAKGKLLGELVVSAASRLQMLDSRFGVSLIGGVFKAGGHLFGPLQETIRSAAPHADVVEPKLPPACGAVVLLLQRAGVEVDGQLVSRMKSSLKRGSVRASK